MYSRDNKSPNARVGSKKLSDDAFSRVDYRPNMGDDLDVDVDMDTVSDSSYPKSARHVKNARSPKRLKEKLKEIKMIRPIGGRTKNRSSFFHCGDTNNITPARHDDTECDDGLKVNNGYDEPYIRKNVNRIIFNDLVKLKLPSIPSKDVDYVIKQPKSFGASSIDEVWVNYATVLYGCIMKMQLFSQAVFVTLIRRGGGNFMGTISSYLYDYKFNGEACVDRHCNCNIKRQCMDVDIYASVLAVDVHVECPLFLIRCYALSLKMYDVLQTYAFWLSQKRNASKYCEFDGYVNNNTGVFIVGEKASLTQQVYKTICGLRKICRIVEFHPSKDNIYAVSSIYNASIQLTDLVAYQYGGLLSDAKHIIKSAYDLKNHDFVKSADLLTVMKLIRSYYVCGNTMRTTSSWRWFIEKLKDRLSIMLTDIFDVKILNVKHLVIEVEPGYTSKIFKNVKSLLNFCSLSEDISGNEKSNANSMVDVNPNSELINPEILSAVMEVEDDKMDCDIVNKIDNIGKKKNNISNVGEFSKKNEGANQNTHTSEMEVENNVSDSLNTPAEVNVSGVRIDDENDNDDNNEVDYIGMTKLFNKIVIDTTTQPIQDEKKKKPKPSDRTPELYPKRTGSDHLLSYMGYFDANSYETYGFLNKIPTEMFYTSSFYKTRGNKYIQHRKSFANALVLYFKLWFKFKIFNASEQLETDVRKHYIKSFVSKYDVRWYEYEGKNALETSKRRVTVDPERMLDRMYCSLGKTIKDEAHAELLELHDNHRTSSRFGGFSDWYRISVASSSISTQIHKFFATDSSYVLHQNQWMANMAWFNDKDFPFLYYHDGKYKVYFNGKNINYTSHPSDFKKLIDEMMSDDFDLSEFMVSRTIDASYTDKIKSVINFWISTRKAIIEKNMVYFSELRKDAIDSFMRVTIYFVNRIAETDEHCYDDDGTMGIFDAITAEWYSEIHNGGEYSQSYIEGGASYQPKSDHDFGNISFDYNRLFGECIPLDYNLDENIEDIITDKTIRDYENTSFDDIFKSSKKCRSYDTAYETLSVWIMLILDYKTEPKLVNNVKYGLRNSIKGLIVWCDKMTAYSNADVLSKMAQESLYKSTYLVDKSSDSSECESENEEGGDENKTTGKTTDKSRKNKEGLEIYEDDYEAFKTNNMGMNLKTDELQSFLMYVKDNIHILQDALKYINDYDYI